jgi:DNA-binding MarR family transcriptional regulator
MENTYSKQLQSVAALLENLSLQGNKRMADNLVRYDLTLAQYLALDALALKNAECSMSELAERIQQSSATMTGIIDRLVDKKWVSRRRSDEDRRAVYVGLTTEGTDLLGRVNAAKNAWMNDTLSKFTPQEVDTFSDLLNKLFNIGKFTVNSTTE